MNTQRIIGAMVWITAILTKSYAKQVPSNFEYTPDGRCPKWLYKHQETCKTDEKLTHIPVTCQESTDGTSGGMVWGFSLDPRHTPCELRKNIGSPDKLADHSLTQTIYTYNKLGFTFTKRGINEFKKRLIRTVQTSIRSMYEHEKYHVQQACPYRQSISNWQLSQLAVMIYPSMSIKSTHAFTEALLATIKSECTSENSIKALSKMHRNQEKYHRQILKRNGKSNKCDRKKLFGAQVMLHDPVGTDVADLKPYLKYKMQQRKNGVQDSEFKEHTALLLDTSINADRINYTYVNPNSIRQIAASEKLGKLHLAEAKLTKDQYMRMLKAMLEYTLRPYPEFIPPQQKNQPSCTHYKRMAVKRDGSNYTSD